MFILANFLIATAQVLHIVLQLYMWLVIIRALLTWVNPDPRNFIVRFLQNATDPLMYRVRRILPLVFGGLDLTPMVVILAIIFLDTFLVTTLIQMAHALG